MARRGSRSAIEIASAPEGFTDPVSDVPEPSPAEPPLSPEVGEEACQPPRAEPGEASFVPSLIIKDVGDRSHSYPLDVGATTIGRAPENTIVLLEENISRRHAKLLREEGPVFLEDLGSSNGTWVNGKKAQPHQRCQLRDNDIIKIGKTLMLFKCSPDD